MGVEGPEPGHGQGGGGKNKGCRPVYGAMGEVGYGTDKTCEDDGEKARAMSSVLGYTCKKDHERDHDDTTAKSREAPESAARKSNDKSFALTPIKRFRRHT